MSLSGATRLCGVVGSPVRHSLSPTLHNAAYAALGLDWAYVAFEVDPGELAPAVSGAKALGLVGLSVTMPFKEQAAALANRRSPTARRLGAANTLTFEKGAMVAESTDGDGLLDDLRTWANFEPEGRRCGVLGAGGAARAVILALAEAGAAEILVVNRTPVTAFRAAALARGIGRVARPAELVDLDLVVQATPVGMPGVGGEIGTGPAEFDPSSLERGQLAVDLVYHPARTPWLRQASLGGARVRNGLGMLVHQAARQVERWTGEPAPLEAMWASVSDDPPRVSLPA